MPAATDPPDSTDVTAAQPVELRSDPTVRFTPGTLLSGRYRIVSPLGKGGMGEVYRADDIRLGQPVALKFLSAAFAADAGRIERLVDEVRVGRQISHPNVCRLYDIAEAEAPVHSALVRGANPGHTVLILYDFEPGLAEGPLAQGRSEHSSRGAADRAQEDCFSPLACARPAAAPLPPRRECAALDK